MARNVLLRSAGRGPWLAPFPWQAALCARPTIHFAKRLRVAWLTSASLSGFSRGDPTDTGSARLFENRDATDTGNVEDRSHEYRAGRLGFFDPRIDIVDREIGHPAFRDAIELRAGQREQPADIFATHLGDPVGALRHWHGIKGPSDGKAVELLRLLGVARHQLVPVETSVGPIVRHRQLL